MKNKIRVTIWNEYKHEKRNEKVQKIHPEGIHNTLKDLLLECDDIEVTTATLDMPEQGLGDEVLKNTDVLLWWGHMAHGEVDDKITEKIRQRIYTEGMGFIPLHSGHHSKPFKAVLGTNGDLSWGADQKEIVWNIFPQHPIAAGIPERFELFEEMYGEPFYVPVPDQLVFSSWFENGNIFRSGCCYFRGLGKIFYFQPGHETCESYHNKYVRQIIKNAVYWAAPSGIATPIPAACVHQKNSVLEDLKKESENLK